MSPLPFLSHYLLNEPGSLVSLTSVRLKEYLVLSKLSLTCFYVLNNCDINCFVVCNESCTSNLRETFMLYN